MDYHSFLIKEAVGGGHLPLWKLLKMLSVRPALPPVPGGKSLLYKAPSLKAPALAGAKIAPANIKSAVSKAEYVENMKEMLKNLPEDHPLRQKLKLRIWEHNPSPVAGGIFGYFGGKWIGGPLLAKLQRKYSLKLGPWEKEEMIPLSASRELMPIAKGPGVPKPQWGNIHGPKGGVFFYRGENKIHAVPTGEVRLRTGDWVDQLMEESRDSFDRMMHEKFGVPPKQKKQMGAVAEVLGEADPKKLKWIKPLNRWKTPLAIGSGVGIAYLLHALQSRQEFSPYEKKLEMARYRKFPEVAGELFKERGNITKQAVRGMLRSKIRLMPQTPELAAALPKATEALSAARGYLQSMASANLDPALLGRMTPQQRDKYLQMILGRGNAPQPTQKVRSILPSLPKDLKGLLM